MVDSLDIAIAVHEICMTKLIPKGVSPPHNIDSHALTTAMYAKQINAAGLNVTGQEVCDAIIRAAMWDADAPWPGHPHPEVVIKILQ